MIDTTGMPRFVPGENGEYREWKVPPPIPNPDWYTPEAYLEYRIKNWAHDDWEGLQEFIDGLWAHTYGKIRKGPKYIKFITGGWSWNEDLLSYLRENTTIQCLFWESSHRGGLEIYRRKQ